MRRSFMDRRIETMLDACARHGSAPAAVRLVERGRVSRRPRRARGASRERGLGWNIVEFKPGALRHATASACSPCAWATGAASPTGRGRLYAEKVMLRRGRTAHAASLSRRQDRGHRQSRRRALRRRTVQGRSRRARRSRSGSARSRTSKTLDLGPGDRVSLEPGESLTLEPFVAHAFWAEGGAVARRRSVAGQRRREPTIISCRRSRRSRRSRRTRRCAT